MPALKDTVEIGPVAHLAVLPVGWGKHRAAITGGVRDIEIWVRGGVRPDDLLDRLDDLEPGGRILVAPKAAVGSISALNDAWLVVKNEVVFITKVPVEISGSDPHPKKEIHARKDEGATGSAVFEPLPAVYSGGLEGYVGSRSEWQQGFVRREIWWLELVPDQIRVWRALGSVKAEREMVRSESWDQARTVMFSEGGTSSSVAALATFGLLGLGARKIWSVVSVAFSDETAVFVIYKHLHHMRPLHDALVREGVSPGKMVFGEGVNPERDQETEALPQGLERIAAMYQQGLLTDEEYVSAKKRLIEGS